MTGTGHVASRCTAVAIQAMPLIVIALAWESAARLKLLPSYIIPPLSLVAERLISMAHEGFPMEVARSMGRLAIGLSGAILTGLTIGILLARSDILNSLLQPVLRSLYPLPKTALIPIVILWFGLGNGANVALVFIGCLVPVVIATYNSAREVEQSLIWSARFLGASEQRIVRDVVVPASLPQILNGIRTALSLAFILVLSAELVIGQNGVGYFIFLMSDNGDYPAMFAAVLTISCIGFAADRLLLFMIARWTFWAEQTDQ